jgi:hypothetical protein
MLDWTKLVRSSEAELRHYPIEAVHLACAVGLPGSERIDHERCDRRIAEMARSVETYTNARLPIFQRQPERFLNSEAYFRALCLITVLQRDMGVVYNPAKIDPDAPFDLEDVFLHGIIQGDGGTCATMPVLYAAVGRKLGYPIKLVTAFAGPVNHLFARWEDANPEKSFNIEATSPGLSTPPDDYYRTGRFQTTPEIERDGCFLVSKTPKVELSRFLVERGLSWLDHGKLRQSTDAFAWASALAPENKILATRLITTMNRWTRELGAMKPPEFPEISMDLYVRYYPDTLPFEWELNIFGLRAMENMLLSQEMNELWWEPLRRGQVPAKAIPRHAKVDCQSDGGCQIGLSFSTA